MSPPTFHRGSSSNTVQPSILQDGAHGTHRHSPELFRKWPGFGCPYLYKRAFCGCNRSLVSNLVCGFIPPAGFPSPFLFTSLFLCPCQASLHFFLYFFCDPLAKVRREIWGLAPLLMKDVWNGAHQPILELPRCPENQKGWRVLF